jgi:Fe2+ transport system protein FeoA
MPTLDQLKKGQRGVIATIQATAPITQRLLEMGLMEGETVEVVAIAPLGDPMELRLSGFHLSVRKVDAAGILVQPLDGGHS